MRVSRYKLQSPSLVRGDVSARKNSPQTTYDSQRSHGFTLIELLVTISIIAILATVFLGVSNSAIESGRRARTKSVIAKIHGLLMERWDSYKTRRVEIAPQLVADIDALGFANRDRGLVLQDVKLLALRELMKLEMPDRWSDITNLSTTVLAEFPPLRGTYLRRYISAPQTPTNQFQGAECLYMIVMLATGDGEARTLFSERDIGDTDGDGAPEFLDGWDQPISFIRWPAGFVDYSDLMLGNADADHDPFDFYRRDQLGSTRPGGGNVAIYPDAVEAEIELIWSRQDNSNFSISAYRLLPLVYSGGPDGLYGLLTNSKEENAYPLDPYFAVDDGLLGSLITENDGRLTTVHIDNIHNHLQDNQ